MHTYREKNYTSAKLTVDMLLISVPVHSWAQKKFRTPNRFSWQDTRCDHCLGLGCYWDYVYLRETEPFFLNLWETLVGRWCCWSSYCCLNCELGGCNFHVKCWFEHIECIPPWWAIWKLTGGGKRCSWHTGTCICLGVSGKFGDRGGLIPGIVPLWRWLSRVDLLRWERM